MIDEIGTAGQCRPEGVSQADEKGVRSVPESQQGRQPPHSLETVISSNFKGLVNGALTEGETRPERIREVTAKRERGELVTLESVRGTAKKLLSEGP